MPRHSLLDNLQGQAVAIVATAFGLTILRAAGLVTGQMAGFALVVSYATGWPFGLVFFAANLPFYAFALVRMGWRFTLRTAIAVVAISALVQAAPLLVTFERLNLYAAGIVGGVCAGLGVLGLFRHGSSGGGFGILAYYVQEKLGFRAGWLQLGFDALIFIAAAFVIDLKALIPSLIGAAILNLIVAINHRRDWYTAR